MSQRPAEMFGHSATVIEPEYVRSRHCDGDCPPWWLVLALHVPADGCTPFTAMLLHRWHLGHAGCVDADIPTDGVLH